MKNILHFLLFFAMGLISYAQTTVSGTVLDDSNNPIRSANVLVINSSNGTATDFDGEFLLEHYEETFTIEVSSVGFKTETVTVTESLQDLVISLQEGTLLDEVVVSASRTPERIFESPVTVEKLGIAEIKNSTSSSFYGGIESLKGVQINNGGLLMKQISTRGFSTVYNEGFLQLVDMMDNSAPGLNFPMGNLLGLNELDVKSVELMPGAASALYGANAIKGILFMDSKDPFNYQGVSAYVKGGVTNQVAAGQKDYKDVGVRIAHAFSDKFAAKASFSMVEGTDGYAVDYSDYNDASKSSSDIDYDGTNIYGEQSSSLNTVFIGGLVAAGQPQAYIDLVSSNPDYFGATEVLSTGYKEVDLTDHKAKSVKIDAALHYKISEDTELSWNSKIGMGSTILQATNRNVLEDFSLQQHKIELNANNFNLRAYATLEDSGNTHDITALAGRISNAQPGGIATGWYGTYLTKYLEVIGGQIAAVPTIGPALAADPAFPSSAIIGHQGNLLAAYGFPAGENPNITDLPGVNTDAAHEAARASADANMLDPDSPEFLAAKKDAISKAISEGGAGIQDQSKSYSFEGDYNLKDVVEFADVIVGASYRRFSLSSNGTLFTDYPDADGTENPIEYSDFGVFAQAVKSLDKLKLTGSLRYDKSEHFDGTFTPRLGLLYDLSEDQNIRISYQTGFRNPSSQDQYIGLDVGKAILMGSSSDNVDRFKMAVEGEEVTGKYVFDNALSASSVLAGAPTPANLKNVVPEQVESFEFGYRLNQQNFNIDLNGYFSKYTNFIAGKNVIVPLTNGKNPVFQVDGNTIGTVNTYGANLGINTKVFGKVKLGFVYEYNKMDYDETVDPDYEPGFNTPENRVKVSVGVNNLIGKLNVGLNARWNDEYEYQATFVDATVPSNTVIDVQANYPLNILDNVAVLKIGASNLFGDDYVQIPGSGMIGQQSYVSLTINP